MHHRTCTVIQAGSELLRVPWLGLDPAYGTLTAMAARPAQRSMKCSLLGHDTSFTAQGRTMVWECRRGCGAGGSKVYDSPGEAARYASVFDKRDSEDLGRRAPLIGLFPLRLWRWWREHR